MNVAPERLVAVDTSKDMPEELRRIFLDNADALRDEVGLINGDFVTPQEQQLLREVRGARDFVEGLEFGRTYPRRYPVRYDKPLTEVDDLVDRARGLVRSTIPVLQQSTDKELVAEFQRLLTEDLDVSAKAARDFVLGVQDRFGVGRVRQFVTIGQRSAAAAYVLLAWAGADYARDRELAAAFSEMVADLDRTGGAVDVLSDGPGEGAVISSPETAGTAIKHVVMSQTELPHQGWIPIRVMVDDRASSGFPSGEDAWASVYGLNGPARIMFADQSVAEFNIVDLSQTEDVTLEEFADARGSSQAVAQLVDLEVGQTPSSSGLDAFRASVEPLMRQLYIALDEDRFDELTRIRVERDAEFLRSELYETAETDWLGETLGAIVARLERDLLSIQELTRPANELVTTVVDAIARDQPAEIPDIVDLTLSTARLDDLDWLVEDVTLAEQYSGQLDLIAVLGLGQWFAIAVGWLGDDDLHDKRGLRIGGVIGLLVAAISKATAVDALTIGAFVGPFVSWLALRYRGRRRSR